MVSLHIYQSGDIVFNANTYSILQSYFTIRPFVSAISYAHEITLPLPNTVPHTAARISDIWLLSLELLSIGFRSLDYLTGASVFSHVVFIFKQARLGGLSLNALSSGYIAFTDHDYRMSLRTVLSVCNIALKLLPITSPASAIIMLTLAVGDLALRAELI